MSSKAQALSAVKIGDIIFGIRDDGRPDLLLVHSAGTARFLARNVLNRTTFTFGRDGEGHRIEDRQPCTIVSTAKLPSNLYDVARGLDRRMGSRPEYPDIKLTEDEIQLVLTHDKFFEARLLPGRESLVKRAQKLRAVTGVLLLEWDPVNMPGNPPSLSEYDDYIPALVDLLERQATADKVAHFLSSMTAREGRPPKGSDRDQATADSLVRLRGSWT